MTRCLGLLGGVASGKSSVGRLLAERGWRVLDADQMARDAVAEPEVLRGLIQRFGDDIVDKTGVLDRAALATKAFADPSATADLNVLVHPRVRQRLAKELAAAADQPVVLDVPLLLDSPLAEHVDSWIFIDSAADRREERARDRGWEAGERARREALQADLDSKRARADHVLSNHGSLADLETELDALLAKLEA